jgi:hypothetical protein
MAPTPPNNRALLTPLRHHLASKKTRNLVKTLRRGSAKRGPLSLAQSLLHTTDYMTPDTIKHKCQERILYLLHTVTTDKLNKIKSRANTAYDTNPKSYHRLLKLKAVSSPHHRHLDPP